MTSVVFPEGAIGDFNYNKDANTLGVMGFTTDDPIPLDTSIFKIDATVNPGTTTIPVEYDNIIINNIDLPKDSSDVKLGSQLSGVVTTRKGTEIEGATVIK